jgi:outer membrane protein TolC
MLPLATPRSVWAEGLTLSDAVRLALARNERSGVARLTVVTAEAAVTKARAGFLPTISLAGSESLRPYSVEESGRTKLATNAASGALSVNQPLLSIPAFPLYAGAKHAREAARHGETDSRRQLAFDAATAFFKVIAEQNLFIAAGRRFEAAAASLADTEARAKAQLTSSNDVTRSRVERAAAQQSVAAARAALAQARITLEYLIGAPLPALLGPPAEKLGPTTLDLALLEKQALAQRPDLASARASVAHADALAREPKWRFVPTLSTTAQVKVADQPFAASQYFDTSLLFSLSWSIWDAGVRGADEASRAAAAQTSQLEADALARKIPAEVRAAVVTLTAAHESLEAARDGVAAARTSAEESTILYKQGLAKAIELVDAGLSRFIAEQALSAAQLAEWQAVLDLRSALGLFPIDGVK